MDAVRASEELSAPSAGSGVLAAASALPAVSPASASPALGSSSAAASNAAPASNSPLLPHSGVVVIGAGPIGLLCALAVQRCLPANSGPVLVLEARSEDSSQQRGQAVRLRLQTVSIIDGLLGKPRLLELSCNARSGLIITVGELQRELLAACRARGIVVRFNSAVKFVLPTKAEAVVLQLADRPSVDARFLILATGYRSGVPVNIYGEAPYVYHGVAGAALVGYCRLPPGMDVLAEDKHERPLCSQSFPLKGNESWLPGPIAAGNFRPHVFVNSSLGGLTVALGFSSDALDILERANRKQFELTPQTLMQWNEQVLRLLEPLPRQLFKFPASFIRDLLLDGLRSAVTEYARFCFVALEWWPFIRDHSWHMLEDGGRYHFRINLLLVDPTQLPRRQLEKFGGALPLLHFNVLTTLQLFHVPNQVGVAWRGFRWYVAGSMGFHRRRHDGTGQLVEDIECEDEEVDNPYLPLPSASLQRVSGEDGAAAAASPPYRYTPPWEWIQLW